MRTDRSEGEGGLLHLIVPGPLDQRTGGYLYDARVARGLRSRGRDVRVHELDGSFPLVDDVAAESLRAALARAADDATVIVDGLAGGALPDVLREAAPRLRLLALVHHPLADESGLASGVAESLFAAEREALAAVRGVVVTSRFTAARLDAYGVPEGRIRVVVPGTEPAATAEGPAPGAPPELLSVGSLVPRKGHDVLIDALARLRDLPWSCTVAGSAELDPRHAAGLRRRVRDTGLRERIRFVGECDSATLDDLYRRATLFVLASRYEGYGMALTEAIARGLPVLSTTGGAIPGTVPSDAGLLVPPDDTGALAAALRALLTDGDAPPRRGRPTLAALRAGARARARELPTWDHTVRAFADAVDALATMDGRP